MPRKTRGQASALLVWAARQARHDPTLAEKKLWQALRGRRLANLKFRRQHPYGRFVLDLFCVQHRLAIEIDGQIHLTPGQAAPDQARTEFLKLFLSSSIASPKDAGRRCEYPSTESKKCRIVARQRSIGPQLIWRNSCKNVI